MTLATDVWILTVRKVRETLRQPVWVALSFVFPLALLVFYAPFLQSLAGGPGFTRGSVLDVFVPGMLVMLAYINASTAGMFLIMELGTGVIERLQVTPVSRFALLMGTALRDVLTMLVPGLVLIAIAMPFGFHPHWAGIALLMALLALLTIAASAASTGLALTARRAETMSAVVNGTMFPLLMISGMMLPLPMAPGWMQALAHIDPLYYAVQGGRELALGTLGSWGVAEAFLVVGGLAVLATLWATRTYRRAVA
jgi:ABC-2 type transport system permease protein